MTTWYHLRTEYLAQAKDVASRKSKSLKWAKLEPSRILFASFGELRPTEILRDLRKLSNLNKHPSEVKIFRARLVQFLVR